MKHIPNTLYSNRFQAMTIVDLGYIQAFGSLMNAIGSLVVGQVRKRIPEVCQPFILSFGRGRRDTKKL